MQDATSLQDDRQMMCKHTRLSTEGPYQSCVNVDSPPEMIDWLITIAIAHQIHNYLNKSTMQHTLRFSFAQLTNSANCTHRIWKYQIHILVGGLAGPSLARPKLVFFSPKRIIDLSTSRGPTWPPLALRAARLLTTGRKQLRAISRHVAGPAGCLRSVTWIAVSTMRTATAAIGTAAAAIGTAAAAIGTATAAGRTATAPALYALIAA